METYTLESLQNDQEWIVQQIREGKMDSETAEFWISLTGAMFVAGRVEAKLGPPLTRLGGKLEELITFE